MAAGDKLGDVYLRGDKSRIHAYWRPADGAPATFLCSMSRSAYKQHSHLRNLFVGMATKIMMNRDRTPENPISAAG
jgi:hypothetical protein